MNGSVDSVARAGPPRAVRPAVFSAGSLARRLLVDRLARRVVVLGGMAIIASILAILIVIAAEVVPLFRPPEARALPGAASGGAAASAAEAAARPLLAGVDEYREIAWFLDAAGTIRFLRLEGAAPAAEAPPAFDPVPLPGLEGSAPASVAVSGRLHAAGTGDGRIVPFTVEYDVTYEDGGRRLAPRVEARVPILLDPEGLRPIGAVAYAETGSGPVAAGLAAGGPGGTAEVVLVSVRERRGLLGGGTREETRLVLPGGYRGEARLLALDGRADDLFVGTSLGQVARYDLRDPASPRLAEVVAAARRPGAAITALGFLLGDRTLVAGDAAGGVTTWQLVRTADGAGRRLARVHAFKPHASAVAAFAPSRRDKGFLTADASGHVRLHYGTSGATLLDVGPGAGAPAVRGAAPAESGAALAAPREPEAGGAGAPAAVVFGPKADGALLVTGDGRIAHWEIRNPHPEITLNTLFGKVWYEGYERPEYVWQSTGGTDDFEAKFSLTPLIFGTLKGTVYALLFAVPLALLGALYASQFMHPNLRGVLKPAVEIMAALPSVVLGFIAGLWLAPNVERVVPGLVLLPAVAGAVLLASSWTWRRLPAAARGRVRHGDEVFLMIPLVLLACWAAFACGAWIEGWLLDGDYRHWLREALGLTYDQRNSLVVGIAMGFAVIPIIFTIAEDSLSNVPAHLTAGSLALGATRWQTALRIVLPTASPGIFSAVMIGFGRAVGETMIVLMATGNTPVMEWSIFNGFRALSANIAVELPEAPEGGTLFRVLFLAALLLFALTFVVNTAAEAVRLKLREKFRYL